MNKIQIKKFKNNKNKIIKITINNKNNQKKKISRKKIFNHFNEIIKISSCSSNNKQMLYSRKFTKVQF